MSIISASAPLGVIAGYGMAAIITANSSWSDAFACQGLIAAACGVVMIGIPAHYINCDKAVKAIKHEKKRRLKEKNYTAFTECGGTGE